MRVLHIMMGYGGGISTFIRNLARANHHPDLVFDVLTFADVPDAFQEEIAQTGGKIFRMPNPKTAGWRAFRKAVRAPFDEHIYDLVHCHAPGRYAIAFWLLMPRGGAGRFILHAHGKMNDGTRNDFGIRARTKLLQLSNRMMTDDYVGCSAQAIRDVFGRVPEEQIMILPNSVDDRSFQRSEAQRQEDRQALFQRLHVEEEAPLMGMIGRLVTVKNHRKMLEIAEQFRQNQRPGYFLVIGDGDLSAALREETRVRHLESRVLFLDRMEPLTQVMAALDAVLLPSFSEGLPTVAIEAQAAGTPVVLSDRITREVDFGLHLLDFVPLEADAAVWAEHLDAVIHREAAACPSAEERHQAFVRRKFTGEEAFQLYVDFLEGRRTHYLLEEG